MDLLLAFLLALSAAYPPVPDSWRRIIRKRDRIIKF
jgi:hypothetical protein